MSTPRAVSASLGKHKKDLNDKCEGPVRNSHRVWERPLMADLLPDAGGRSRLVVCI